MNWANENQEWKRQQEQKAKTKESREKFKAASGNTAEWNRVYKNYLSSQIWQEIKRRKFKQVGYKCERCGAEYINEAGLQVHHLNYDRVGGLEKDGDLQIVCAGECHEDADEEREERVESERRYAEYERWFENWGTKVHKDDWVIKKYDDEMKMREEFCKYAYKKWCEDNNKVYRSYLKIPDEFIELLENGLYDEYEEESIDDDFFLVWVIR